MNMKRNNFASLLVKPLSWGLASLLIFSASAFAAELVEVKVNGMVCSFCVRGIKKTFSEIQSVQNVNVDLDKHLVSIEVKDTGEISDEEIRSSLTKSGYEVLEIKRNGN
jgi:copper chaperone CopZ